MTAVQQVPAGVARILVRRAVEARRAAEAIYQDPPEDMVVRKFNGVVHFYDVAMREWVPHIGGSADKLAQEWLDGLERMALVPMEVEL